MARTENALAGDLTSIGELDVPTEATVSGSEKQSTLMVLLEYVFQLQRKTDREKALRQQNERVTKGRFVDIDARLNALEPVVAEIMTGATVDFAVTPFEGGEERYATLQGLPAMMLSLTAAEGSPVIVTGEAKGQEFEGVSCRILRDEGAGTAEAQGDEPAQDNSGEGEQTASEADSEPEAGGDAAAEDK